jgi:hypothetical protein
MPVVSCLTKGLLLDLDPPLVHQPQGKSMQIMHNVLVHFFIATACPLAHLVTADSLASSTANGINSTHRAVTLDNRLTQVIRGSTTSLIC